MTTPYLINPVEEKANKRKSAALTTLIVLALLIFAWFFILKQQPPEWPSGGILIDMGTTDEGFGQIEPNQAQPESTPVPPQPSEEPAEEEVESNEMNATEVNVQDKQEEQETEAEPEHETEPTPEPAEEKPKEEPKPNPKYTFPGSESNQNNESQSQGNNPMGEGNMGQPDGGDSDNYDGMNSGTGDWGNLGGNLSGRGWISSPGRDVTYSNITGVVEAKFKITVDANGDIVDIKDDRNTQLSDPQIRSQLIRELKKARLNKSNQPLVSGTVTFVLKGR